MFKEKKRIKIHIIKKIKFMLVILSIAAKSLLKAIFAYFYPCNFDFFFLQRLFLVSHICFTSDKYIFLAKTSKIKNFDINTLK